MAYKTRYSRKKRLKELAKYGFYPTSTTKTNIAINNKGDWKFIDNRNPIVAS